MANPTMKLPLIIRLMEATREQDNKKTLNDADSIEGSSEESLDLQPRKDTLFTLMPGSDQ